MDRAYDVGEIPRDSLWLTYMESGVDPAILERVGGGQRLLQKFKVVWLGVWQISLTHLNVIKYLDSRNYM